MGVSVIIPTCGRPQLLSRCLQALARQENAGAWEVVVVDDAGDPAAAPVVDEARALFPDKVPVRCLRLERNAGPAAARNAGWKQAAYQVIAFTDDDTLPAPDWLALGLRAMSREHVVAVAGGVQVPLRAEPTDYERNESRLGEAAFVTANCFVSKTALEKIGGFDERFRAAWREDSDLHFRLLQHAALTGQRIVRDPAAQVIHPVRKAGWGVSLRQQQKSFYNALLFKKHPWHYRRGIQSHPPYLYYGYVAGVVMALVGVLTNLKTLAVMGAMLWFWCYAVFLGRRLRDTSHRASHVLEMVITSLVIPFLSIYWRLRGALAFRVWFA